MRIVRNLGLIVLLTGAACTSCGRQKHEDAVQMQKGKKPAPQGSLELKVATLGGKQNMPSTPVESQTTHQPKEEINDDLSIITLNADNRIIRYEGVESVSVNIKSPETGIATGIKFGIPLGDVSDVSKIAVYHKAQRIDADVFPMGDWTTQPSNWALIAMPVPQEWGGKSITLDIRTDVTPQAPSENIVLHRESKGVVTIHNGVYELRLGPDGIESISAGGNSFSPTTFSPGILLAEGDGLARAKDVAIEVQWDGKLYKRLRWEGTIAVSKRYEFRVQWEMDIYAGSPVIRSRVRFANIALLKKANRAKGIAIYGIAPFSAQFNDAEDLYVGGPTITAIKLSHEENKGWHRGAEITQKKYGWHIAHKKGHRAWTGDSDSLGEWISFKSKGGLNVMIQARGFQEEGPTAQGQKSILSLKPDSAALIHWKGKPTMFFSNTARGFDVDIVVGQKILSSKPIGYGLGNFWQSSNASDIVKIKEYPYVVYNREYMTAQGVLTESGVSHLVDAELKAITENADLIMVNRRTDGARWRFDNRGETTDNVMYYRWTWKFWVNWNDLDSSGFMNKAILENYIRFGDDSKMAYFALDQARVWSENSYDLITGGVRHYRYKAPHAYSVMNEHLMAYKLTGEPFMLEGAKKIAAMNRSNFVQRECPRYHKETWYARDGNWEYYQGRAAHPAIDMWRLYEFLGDKKNRDFSARVYGEHTYSLQEPEGFILGAPGATISEESFKKDRSARCSAIFTGYSMPSLSEVFWRLDEGETKEQYKKMLLLFANWYCDVVEDANGGCPGMVGNSVWYGSIGTQRSEAAWRKTKKPGTWMPGKPIEQSVTTLMNAFVLADMYRLTKDHKYFYTANASYFGALSAQHSSGSFPIDYVAPSNCSGWAGQYLPQLYWLAERDKLPIAIKARRPDRRGAYNDQFFMGKGATWDGATFRFAIQHRRYIVNASDAARDLDRFPIPDPAGPECNDPIPLTIYFPPSKPNKFTLNGEHTEFTYDAKTQIITTMLPPVKVTTIYNIEIR